MLVVEVVDTVSCPNHTPFSLQRFTECVQPSQASPQQRAVWRWSLVSATAVEALKPYNRSTEQTPCPVTPAAAIYRIVTSSLTISWLSCPVPELLTRLAIYVVPFSNAKVVGSFRMARLNMFRRWSGAAKNFSSLRTSREVVYFAEVLLFTEYANYTPSTLKAL